MADTLPDWMVTYLNDRDTQRANNITAFLDKLTPRERGIFHDAAVMGYVQGLMRDRDDGAPKDSQTVPLVVDACLAIPDKYPTVAQIAALPAPKPVWRIETYQRGEWRQWQPDRDDRDEARADYDRVVADQGNRWLYRLVRIDTTRTLEAQNRAEED